MMSYIRNIINNTGDNLASAKSSKLLTTTFFYLGLGLAFFTAFSAFSALMITYFPAIFVSEISFYSVCALALASSVYLSMMFSSSAVAPNENKNAKIRRSYLFLSAIMGVMVGFIYPQVLAVQNGALILMSAGAITLSLIVALYVVAVNLQNDTKNRWAKTSYGMTLFVLIITGLFLSTPTSVLIHSLFSVAVFSGVLLVDFCRLLFFDDLIQNGGGERTLGRTNGTDPQVEFLSLYCATNILLDAINIFTDLIQVMLASKNKNVKLNGALFKLIGAAVLIVPCVLVAIGDKVYTKWFKKKTNSSSIPVVNAQPVQYTAVGNENPVVVPVQSYRGGSGPSGRRGFSNQGRRY